MTKGVVEHLRCIISPQNTTPLLHNTANVWGFRDPHYKPSWTTKNISQNLLDYFERKEIQFQPLNKNILQLMYVELIGR